MRKSTHRKEARIKEVLGTRGDHPGLVHVLSAMEACPSYRPWYSVAVSHQPSAISHQPRKKAPEPPG